jgi:hypothetical protein
MFVVLLMHSFEITKVKFKRMARAFGLLIYCYEKKSATREPRLGVSWEQNELRSKSHKVMPIGIHAGRMLTVCRTSVPREYWTPRVAGSSTSRWLADAVPFGLGNGRASRKGQARRLSVCNFVGR